MVPFHPLIVHFPIALLICAVIFYVLEFVLRKPRFGEFGFYLHVGGLLACIAAILSGDAAESALVNTREIYDLASLHETLGMLVAWGFGVLAVWAYLRRESKIMLEKLGFLLAYAGMIALLTYSAHLGGEMVYEHGAGVAPMQPHLEQQFQQEQSQKPE